MPADSPGDLSPVAAAEYFLCWQDPTDRALAGWCPFPGIYNLGEDRLQNWLTSQVTLNREEISSRERYQEADGGGQG